MNNSTIRNISLILFAGCAFFALYSLYLGLLPFPVLTGRSFEGITHYVLYRDHEKSVSMEVQLLSGRKETETLLENIAFLPMDFRPRTLQMGEVEMYKGGLQYVKIRLSPGLGVADVVWAGNSGTYLVNPGFRAMLGEKETASFFKMRILRFDDDSMLPRITTRLKEMGYYCGVSDFNPFYYFIYDNEPVYETWGERKIKVFFPSGKGVSELLELEREGLFTIVRRDIGRQERFNDYRDYVLEQLYGGGGK